MFARKIWWIQVVRSCGTKLVRVIRHKVGCINCNLYTILNPKRGDESEATYKAYDQRLQISVEIIKLFNFEN